jgi:response regulator RpfG family c-di-GMP phosphodiesterase
LRVEEYEVVTAESIADALDKLKKQGGVDLILSDNRLSDGQGTDFLVKAKQLYPDTIRILFTGYPDLDSAISAINRGQVYRYITKPWNNDELKMVVKQALDYYDVLRDNKVLLTIAKQQSQMLSTMEAKYPQVKTEADKSLYIIDEKRVSETLEEFLKKYYPGEK